MENKNALMQVATRLSIKEDELKHIIVNTVMPGGNCTKEQFLSFVAVANEYGLNPLTKEIYAFPTKGGGIQPIVSIDGWLHIINKQPSMNGMTFVDKWEDGKLLSVTCKIYKKGIDHPIEVTEYMAECKRGTEPWTKWPSRMLRHKAVIQAGRYAFGLSGIIDPDEAERYNEVGVIDTQPDADDGAGESISYLSGDEFEEKFAGWQQTILEGGKEPQEIIGFLESKGVHMTEEQATKINNVGK